MNKNKRISLCDFRSSGEWRLAGCSVRGASHKDIGTCCQDAFAFQSTSAGVHIAAVSDGAGSRPLSHVGAQLAVSTCLSKAEALIEDDRNYLKPDFMLEVFNKAHEVLKKKASEKEGLKLSDLACTLIMTIWTDSDFSTAHVGDGGAICMLDDGPHIAARPAESDLANYTDMITSDSWQETIQYEQQSNVNVHSIAMFTDGLQNLAFRTEDNTLTIEEKFIPFLAKEFLQDEDDQISWQLTHLLMSKKVKMASEDDKTLLLAVRCEKETIPDGE